MRRHRSRQSTCSKCEINPKRPGNGWCYACHAAAEVERRSRQRAALAELDAMRATFAQLRAAGVIADAAVAC